MVAHRLLHIHLPSRGPTLYPPYTIASRLQEHLRRRQLDFKDSNANTDTDTPHTHGDIATGWRPGVTSRQQRPAEQKPTGPPPTLLSFTPLPTYTLGRRQTAPLNPDELARLQAPLVHYPPINVNGSDDRPGDIRNAVTVLPSPRGGLTTYHGPGQIVLWPVLDLRSRWHKNFTVRCYSRLLEDTTIATLGRLTWPQEGGLSYLNGFTTEDPGVWVNTAIPSPSTSSVTTEMQTETETKTQSETEKIAKIAALGVHLRRHISALGTAINVNMPGPEDLSPETNPWARIVACGLEGKTVTSIHRELEARLRGLAEPRLDETLRQLVTKDINEEGVARVWAEELSGRLLCREEVERMSPREVARFVLWVCGGGGGEAGSTNAMGQEEGEHDSRNVELEMRYLGWLREEFGG